MKRIVLGTAAAFVAAAVLFCLNVGGEPAVSARCAVLMDAHSGRILWEKSAHERSLIASTTKIMTGLIIAEECHPEELVTVSLKATGIEGSSMYLSAGEQITVAELLYGMMLHSGNDAAAALAIHHSGSIGEFAQVMNQRARELGLSDTQFVNPHGLDAEQHYSTAADLAKLAAAAMENELFAKVVSTEKISLNDRTFANHNRLLQMYDGAIGVKTGYTRAAGRILVSCARREDRKLIAVTIHAPDDWNDHRILLDYGFSAYAQRTLAEAGNCFGVVPVAGGVCDAEAVVSEPIRMTLAQGERVRLQAELPQFVYPPVLSGEPAGTLVIYLNDTEWKRVPLVWRDTVMEEA